MTSCFCNASYFLMHSLYFICFIAIAAAIGSWDMLLGDIRGLCWQPFSCVPTQARSVRGARGPGPPAFCLAPLLFSKAGFRPRLAPHGSGGPLLQNSSKSTHILRLGRYRSVHTVLLFYYLSQTGFRRCHK